VNSGARFEASGASKRPFFETEVQMARAAVVRWAVSIAVALCVITTALMGAAADRPAPWRPSELLAPADLVKALQDGPAPRIVYVGFRALYRTGHIPGASYHGPASDAAGLADLREWARSLPRAKRLVIYCGCCPLDHCPNVGPAFAALRDMGFDDVRVLNLPTSFAADWVEKGYPVSRE
jgi:hypothetical protein